MGPVWGQGPFFFGADAKRRLFNLVGPQRDSAAARSAIGAVYEIEKRAERSASIRRALLEVASNGNGLKEAETPPRQHSRNSNSSGPMGPWTLELLGGSWGTRGPLPRARADRRQSLWDLVVLGVKVSFARIFSNA